MQQDRSLIYRRMLQHDPASMSSIFLHWLPVGSLNHLKSEKRLIRPGTVSIWPRTEKERGEKERKKKKGQFPCFPWHWELAKNFGAEVHANPLSLRWLTSLSSGLLVSRITDDGHALSVIHRFFKSPGRSQLSSHRSFWRFLRKRLFTFFHSLRLHVCSDNIQRPCCVHFLTPRFSNLDSLVSLSFR